MTKETINAFGDAINAHDIARISALMTSDHVSVDAMGNEMKGTEKAAAGWEDCFKMFPDYKIEITDVIVDGDNVAAFGFAEGSYKGAKENHWRVPASWKGTVHEHKINSWQIYADTKLASDLIGKSSTSAAPGVTGVGGLFFKCKDPKNLMNWYKEHLHVNTSPYGATFNWRQGDDASKYGCTQWSPFPDKTTYFAPSAKDFMINYRVQHIEQLVEQLKKEGVTILDNVEDSDYGKFVHIMDCEDNKVELWEPKEEDYNKKMESK